MSHSAKRKLLIIDDDEDVLAGIGFRLRAAGYDTCIAHDGAEGLETAVRERPDAILLDVRMPRLDGLSALKTLRTQPETRHIPVVMLSASLPDEKPALDSGARFFLRKPYRASTLMAAVHAVVPDSGHTDEPDSKPIGGDSTAGLLWTNTAHLADVSAPLEMDHS